MSQATTLLATLALLAATAPAAAQGGGQGAALAARVAAVGNGTARLSFTAHPGVCGDGERVISTGSSHEWTSDCEDGPVRVALDVHGGRVTAVRAHVGGRWLPGDASTTDLGRVPGATAADYLLGLAGSAPEGVAKHAILPAVLADSAVTWPALLRLARDESRPSGVRRDATFWAGQQASNRVAPALEGLADDEGVDMQIRKQAVFALSQRPADEGVPALIRVVRTSTSPTLRRTALFWLGQSGDPRALDLFKEILSAH